MLNLLGGRCRWPAESGTAGAGGVEAFAGALDDHLADELAQGGEDVEDQPAARGGGVQRFVQRPEADLSPSQVTDDRVEVLEVAA